MESRKLDVLLVDDDVSFCDAVLPFLERRDCRILKAAKVVDAISKLKNQKFDLIILDMRLEGGSGEQVVSFARANKGFNQEAPILVMSGFLDASLVKRLGSQVNGVLVKPFDPKTFAEKLDKILASPKKRISDE